MRLPLISGAPVAVRGVLGKDLLIICANQPDIILNPFNFSLDGLSKITTDSDSTNTKLAEHNIDEVFTVSPDLLTSKKQSLSIKTLKSLQLEVAGTPPSLNTKTFGIKGPEKVLVSIKPFEYDPETKLLTQLHVFCVSDHTNFYPKHFLADFSDFDFCAADKDTEVFTETTKDNKWMMKKKFVTRYNIQNQ